jgi:hypothetical protein
MDSEDNEIFQGQTRREIVEVKTEQEMNRDHVALCLTRNTENQKKEEDRSEDRRREAGEESDRTREDEMREQMKMPLEEGEWSVRNRLSKNRTFP